MKGILYNPEMIIAGREGRKDVTRRIEKSLAVINAHLDRNWVACAYEPGPRWIRFHAEDGQAEIRARPRYLPGEIVYVKEGWKHVASGLIVDGYGKVRNGIAYRLDSFVRWQERTTEIHDLSGQPNIGPMQFKDSPWKSPLIMSASDARYWTRIKDVRAERLNAITEEEAFREGMTRRIASRLGLSVTNSEEGFNLYECRRTFRGLWQSINGPGSWDTNPWVFRYEFEWLTKLP